jgi:DNA polymerase I-like protein with 3'-5' exonuclease and polymerase domains
MKYGIGIVEQVDTAILELLFLAAYNKHPVDLHMETAKHMFNTPQPTPEQQREAKTRNFHIIYGVPYGSSVQQ